MLQSNRFRKFFAVMISALLLFIQGGIAQLPTAHAETITNAVTVTIIDPNGEEPVLKTAAVPFEEGDTAFDLLVDMDENEIIEFEYSNSDLGPYITSFNGIDPAETEFWSFVINGVSSMTGVSEYELNQADHLLFVLTDWSLPEEKLSITVTAAGKDGNTVIPETAVELVPGATAYDALVQAALVNNVPLNISIDSVWLNSVNNIGETNLGETEFWASYMNGVSMQTGVAGYHIQACDRLYLMVSSWGEDAEYIEKIDSEIEKYNQCLNTLPEPEDKQEPEKEDSHDEKPALPALNEEDLTEAINKSYSYLIENNSLDWYGLIALSALNKELPRQLLDETIGSIKLNNGQFRNVTDIEKAILILTASGKDAKNAAGFDLIELLLNHENMTSQGNNGIIYALLALDSGNYEIPEGAKWSRESLVQHLLDTQLDNGAWSLVGNAASADLTGMALAALAPYMEDDEVNTAVDQAVQWLSGIQTDHGGFYDEFNGGEASESIAQAIIGLTAVQADPAGDMFTKSDVNLVQKLLSFQLNNGSFTHLSSEQEGNVFSTNQAILALAAYERYISGEAPVFQLNSEQTLQPVDEEDAGLPLPQTASTLYEGLLYGMLIVVAAALIFAYQRKQILKK